VIADAEERLSVRRQINVLDEAAIALRDDCLGFTMARDFDPRELGLLYYVMASSRTLGDALKRVARYSQITKEALVVRYREQNGPVISLGYSGVPRHLDRHQMPTHGRVVVDDVARSLAMSKRTLARRLADEGLNFTEILQQLRRDLALRYLEDRKLHVSKIAWLLGFNEVSAFTHAYKRWTGKTPSEMRTVGT
jgi:AraC-like DNA-binding protein